MSIPGNKQTFNGVSIAKPIEFNGFPGGIDFRASPEAIPISCASRADNAEYDAGNGVLRKADGITIVSDALVSVESGFKYNGYTLFNSGQNLYRVDLTAPTPSKTLIGTLTGASEPQYCLWGSYCLVASGGKLQRLSNLWALDTMVNSPNCNFVWIGNDGKVNVAKTGDDFIYMSKIGDETVWDAVSSAGKDWTSTLATDPKYIEIGYKDGMDIVRIDRLGPDIIIHKSNGEIYAQHRLIGLYPNWTRKQIQSLPIIHSVSALNDIFVIGRAGLKSLTNVVQYGDIAQDETGAKVNVWLVKQVMTAAARVWHIPSKKQIAVKVADNKTLWLYHYLLKDPVTGEVGAWTRRDLTANVKAIWEDSGTVYIAYGNKIGKFDSTASKDDSTDFMYRISSKRFVSKYTFDMSRYILDMENNRSGVGNLIIGPYNESISFASSNEIAADDHDIARDDTDPAAGGAFTHYEKYFSASAQSFQITISCSTGTVGFRYLAVDVAEV